MRPIFIPGGVSPSVALLVLVAAAAPAARAQVAPPFFNGAPSAFTPEISIVTTGTVNDVQAVVSADRKYVTLNMRAANSSLLALRSFTFQSGNGNLGFVGMPNTAGARTTAAPQSRTPAWDVRPQVQSNILARPGMTRVGG